MMRRRWDSEVVAAWSGFALALLIFGGFALVLVIEACGGLNIEYSVGTRSGVVTKLSRKGMFWKTYEGELDLRRMKAAKNADGQTVGMVADIFHFSVSDPAIAREVEAAERHGDRVTLSYKQYLLRGWKYGASTYDVVGVEIGDQPAP